MVMARHVCVYFISCVLYFYLYYYRQTKTRIMVPFYHQKNFLCQLRGFCVEHDDRQDSWTEGCVYQNCSVGQIHSKVTKTKPKGHLPNQSSTAPSTNVSRSRPIPWFVATSRLLLKRSHVVPSTSIIIMLDIFVNNYYKPYIYQLVKRGFIHSGGTACPRSRFCIGVGGIRTSKNTSTFCFSTQ